MVVGMVVDMVRQDFDERHRSARVDKKTHLNL
jgi:hypothetical protein